MQPYLQYPYTHTPMEAVFTLADDPLFLTRPHLVHTISGEAPNPWNGPSGSNADAHGPSTISKPTSLTQQIRPIRSGRANRRQEPTPYRHPMPSRRKTRAITYEGNPLRLQQRCKRQGADEGAIELLGKIFPNGVNLEALTRPLTDAEAETQEFGIETGMIYTAFLEYADDEDARYTCRLCHSEQTWKHQRDVLRHLRRNHFGLADVCDQWYVFNRSLTSAYVNIMPSGDAAQRQTVLHQRREEKAPLQVD